jgi:hypothetical protein
MPKPIRPIRIEGNLAYVPLTQGLEAIIDAKDAKLVKHRNWFASVNGRNRYALSKLPTECKPISIHRFLMKPEEGYVIDHINGDGLDNRRENLRLANSAQNAWNSRIAKNNTSGFKGVTFNKREGRWRAKISHDGKRINIGTYDTAELASAAYEGAARALFGAYARIE